MKIISIIPHTRDSFQRYLVTYEENFLEKFLIEREKKIIKIFSIDKQIFKEILFRSMEENF